METLQDLKKSILEDGVIDAEEASNIILELKNEAPFSREGRYMRRQKSQSALIKSLEPQN